MAKTDCGRLVLSACETAQGQIDYGEGVSGLVRAFRTAGVRYVLVALRPVGDQGASVFMQRFYHHWLHPGTQRPRRRPARRPDRVPLRPRPRPHLGLLHPRRRMRRPMIRFILVTALSFAAAGTGSPAYGADPVPTDNRTCFCLRHTASGAIATGCHGSKGRADFYPTAICWDEHAQKPGTSFTVDDRWSLIKEGDDRCRPCERRSPPPLNEGAAQPGLNTAKSPSLGEIVSAATFVIAVLTAWLYTMGWTYLYHYFLQFRIPLLLIDLPLQHYLIYGGLVLWKSIWVSVAVSVVVLALAWACMRFASRLGRFVLSAIVIVAILALFIAGRAAAMATAQAEFRYQYQNDYPDYPRIALLLKKEASETHRRSAR